MIHYIGFFYDLSSPIKKNASPALVTKMKYVAKKLMNTQGEIKIFSPAYSMEEDSRYIPAYNYLLESNIEVIEAATIGRKNYILKILGILFSHFQLFKYLLCDVNKKDIVVVYHSMFYLKDFQLYRFFRKTSIVMEVEELYSAAWNKTDYNKEIQYLSKYDAYIYVNDIMNEKFGFNKPYAVCYGNYDVSPNYYVRNQYKNLIYAGVLGRKGSDVDLAIEIMKYLPDTYSLKIAGYGSEADLEYLKNKIYDKKNIEYVGFLSGEEYEAFLNKGDLGLCTRVLANNLSDYTFPSKVLVYLTHGLVPVCPSIDCLKKSKVSEAILFYNDSTPESVASSIKENCRGKDSKRLVRELDDSFDAKLAFVLSTIEADA